jgi:uncharacterized protein
MMLDAKIALHASDSGTARFEPTSALATSLINGNRRVAIPWQTIGSDVGSLNPATGTEAWTWVEGWLARDVSWIPPANEATARVYGEIARTTPVTGNLVPDAMLAALAGLPGLRWRNPLDDDMSGD